MAGGTSESIVGSVQTSLGFLSICATWSKSSDSVALYVGGGLDGTPQSSLGTWAGVLSSTQSVIGAQNITPLTVWSGNLAHGALWSKALTPAQFVYLSEPT